MHHLKDENGTLITDRVEIANALGAAIEKKYFRKLPQRVPIYQGTKGKHKINFKRNKIFVMIRSLRWEI